MFSQQFILIVDDSPVAINQARGILQKIGVDVISVANGKLAYELLKAWAAESKEKIDQCLMVLTDAEMDGYRLTTEIRQDQRLKHLHVIMHTSLSGSFNQAMAQKVGCDSLLLKFQPDELAVAVLDYIREINK